MAAFVFRKRLASLLSGPGKQSWSELMAAKLGRARERWRSRSPVKEPEPAPGGSTDTRDQTAVAKQYQPGRGATGRDRSGAWGKSTQAKSNALRFRGGSTW